MEKEELVKILVTLNNSYNNFHYPLGTIESSRLMLATWNEMIGHYDYYLAATAIKSLIVNMPDYPPNLGQVVQAIEKLLQPARLTPGEAWAEVLNSIGKYGYYNEKEGIESLSPLVRQAVECMGGYRDLCMAENNSYLYDRFAKIYNGLEVKSKEFEMLPKPVKVEVQKLVNKFTNNKNNKELITDGRSNKNRITGRTSITGGTGEEKESI
jgi:hypothetical protein